MKKIYSSPEAVVVDVIDVVTTSGPDSEEFPLGESSESSNSNDTYNLDF